MVTREHTTSGQIQRFTVTRSAAGWEVREEDGSRIVRRTTYTDWHRVERAMQVFELKGLQARDLQS